jgi:hypothetical protein
MSDREEETQTDEAQRRGVDVNTWSCSGSLCFAYEWMLPLVKQSVLLRLSTTIGS